MVTKCEGKVLYFKEDIAGGRYDVWFVSWCVSFSLHYQYFMLEPIRIKKYPNCNHTTHWFRPYKCRINCQAPFHLKIYPLLVIYSPICGAWMLTNAHFLSHQSQHLVLATTSPVILTRSLYHYGWTTSSKLSSTNTVSEHFIRLSTLP